MRSNQCGAAAEVGGCWAQAAHAPPLVHGVGVGALAVLSPPAKNVTLCMLGVAPKHCTHKGWGSRARCPPALAVTRLGSQSEPRQPHRWQTSGQPTASHRLRATEWYTRSMGVAHDMLHTTAKCDGSSSWLVQRLLLAGCALCCCCPVVA